MSDQPTQYEDFVEWWSNTPPYRSHIAFVDIAHDAWHARDAEIKALREAREALKQIRQSARANEGHVWNREETKDHCMWLAAKCAVPLAAIDKVLGGEG
jgi:hypothetical protein